MGKYITTAQVWNAFGEDAFTKVRGETLGTGSGSLTTFSFAKDNLISGSVAIYSAGTALSSGYTLNLDDGTVSLTAGSVAYTADYNYAGLLDSHVQKIVLQSEEELERVTGRNFDLTTTSEYLDYESGRDTYFLKNYPVQTLVSLSSNTNYMGDTPNWVSLVEGQGNDYLQIVDDDQNEFVLLDNFPAEGRMAMKANYVYGYTSSDIPDTVQELSVLLSQKKMINSGIYKAVVQGDTFNEAQLADLNKRIDKLTRLLSKQDIDII